ncbi:hypothetical protein AC578_2050, partial [Pseudocercospora eumusae]
MLAQNPMPGTFLLASHGVPVKSKEMGVLLTGYNP